MSATATRPDRSYTARRWWVVVWLPLLAISAAAVWYVVAVFVPHERSAAIEVWRGRLSAMADDRKTAITSWLSHRLGDARVVAEDPTAVYLLSEHRAEQHLLAQQERRQRQVQRLLDSMQGAHGYRAAYALDAGGNVVVDGTGSPPLEPACRASVARVLSLGHPEVELHAHADGLPMLAITAPVRVADRTVGAVLLSDDPARWLYPLLLSEPIPTRTGESLLAHQVGNQVEFLSPLRHRSAPPLSFRLPFALPLLAVAAIRGEEGFRSYVDYRGVRVLGVARRIPGTGWGLVVKVDEDEAFSAFRRSVREFALAWACVLLALAGVGFGVWRTQAASYRAQLGESEARFALLRDHTREGIWFVSRDGVILDANESAAAMHGCTREEFTGRNARDFRPPEDPAVMLGLMNGVRRGEGGVFETQHARRDGSVFPIEVSSQVMTFHGEEVYLSVYRDITDRKRAEETLRESEERFRTMADSLPQLAWIAKADGFIYWYNRRWFDYTGTTPRQMEGWGWQSVHDPNVLPRVLEQWQGSIATGRPFDMEFPLRGADGKFRPFLTRVMPLKDGQGKVLQWFGTNTDISERAAAEQAIREANEALEVRVQERTAELTDALQAIRSLNADLEHRAGELEAANKELEAFSHSVSHDLRAPLRAIDGFSRIVMDDYGDRLDDEGKRQLEVIRANTQKMGRLIDDLLAFSRAGRAELRRADVDMKGLVHSVFPELVPTEEGRARIDFVVGKLPSAWADGDLIRQVWVNLLSNAVKFSCLRERAVIHVTGALEDDRVVYHVSDNGVGFDMRYADKLFGVFQRLHSSREFEGTGVGLALAQRIVHRHDGEVWGEGTVDGGATFSFALPEERNHEPR